MATAAALSESSHVVLAARVDLGAAVFSDQVESFRLAASDSGGCPS